MRILAIRGKNLASLEGEFEVDFAAEPLKSAGIFAITGSTGSGKSTLLDAICLALFGDTPRISRAESAKITDVRDETIAHKDPRSILRRGTSDGYAEVDFVSLAGDKYRARWSVRRARDKVDGSLQDVNYRVWSIISGDELLGRKTDLLEQVKNLIGLTFDQFTRAVLLAQGDFATFLKANKNEKAELLEKLTGTDIYSRISVKIYENSKQADSELSLVRELIKGVELLPEEQIDALASEKDRVAKEAGTLEAEVKSFSEKLQWLQVNEQLINGVETANNELIQSKTAIEDAKPRFDYLTRTESVQEIRDIFKKQENNRKQLAVDELSINQQLAEDIINSERLVQIKALLENCLTAKDQLTAEWQKIDIQIKEARKLDVQIDGVAKNLSDTGKEVSQIAKQEDECEKRIETCGRKIESIMKSQERISKWFDENSHYAGIIPRIELIISYINDSQSTAKLALSNERLLNGTSELLTKEEEQLVIQQAETKRLNDILPSEIAVLRAKLIENEPCPVCGSIQHPISGVNAESLEEEALNRAKAIVIRDIERLAEDIDKRKSEIIRLQSLIDGYKEQHNTVFTKLTDMMKIIPEWEIMYKKATLCDDLMAIAKTWGESNTQRTSLTEQLATQNQELIILQQLQAELNDNLKGKQNKQITIATEFEQLQGLRKKLLGRKSANKVEQSYHDRLTKADNLLSKATVSLNKLVATGEKIAGAISQLTNSILRLKREIEGADKNIFDWLLTRNDGLTMKELAELLAIDSSWLIVERTALDILKNAELSAQTKLNERQSWADEHQKSTIKPTDKETKEFLTAIIDEKTQYLKHKLERITEIGVLFINQEKGKTRIKQFENELTVKGVAVGNWRKLNDLFGSADGAKFKVLAQGYTLDVLLGYANKHLKDISQRYLLERVSTDSLSLQVVDLDMLSEVRSVHSLSGGESFLVSLSLALGLSSLSSNRMRVESLFIDEGFGSLDADTLRVAMDALERIQTQGRKIGVISHVAEMTERIPAQIQVIKTVNGKSRIEIKG
ncbi:MAG: AAA family ATPase [Cytophagaceae bacterium]|jgi:exonuclease SbcC|nr:AAA family ATPase [Cytophagaceae bacterium]